VAQKARAASVILSALAGLPGLTYFRARRQVPLSKAAMREEKPLPTIDVQVHAYGRNHPGRPWVGTLHGPAEATGDQMVAAMDDVGVQGAVLVSPFDPES